VIIMFFTICLGRRDQQGLPRSLSKSDIYLVAHSRKDGTPVNAETREKNGKCFY